MDPKRENPGDNPGNVGNDRGAPNMRDADNARDVPSVRSVQNSPSSRNSRNSRNSRKGRQFAGISQVLGNVLDQAGLGFLAYEEKLRQHWTELIGPRASAIAKLESLKGWTLRVRVESATWRNELHFQKDALRKRANELLGAELVRDIQLM